MSTLQDLLSNAAPWRRLFYVSVILTATCVWLKPWQKTAPPTNAVASYQPPPPVPTGNVVMPVVTAPSNMQGMGTPNSGGSLSNGFSWASVHEPSMSFGQLDANFGPPMADAVSGPRQASASFSPNTELHLVGVYEGALPNGVKDDPASKCMQLGFSPNDRGNGLQDCVLAQTQVRRSRAVTVTVSRANAPIVLVLMAYAPVDWKLVPMSGVKLAKVIVAGYGGQDIAGVPAGVPVEVRSYQNSPCNVCTRVGDYFHTYQQNTEYQRIVAKLQRETGLQPSSFQGAYSSDRFLISSNLATYTPSTSSGQSNFMGKVFSDRVVMNGREISLPEGKWKAIGYSSAPSNLGTDQSLLLNRLDSKPNAELLAIRLKTATSGSGFPVNVGCDRTRDYMNLSVNNVAAGDQLCYWVGYVGNPFRQSIFYEAANELSGLGILQTPVVVASSFHKADRGSSLELLDYSIPDSKFNSSGGGISKWDKGLLANDSERKKYVDERIAWARSWFQFFKLGN